MRENEEITNAVKMIKYIARQQKQHNRLENNQLNK